MGKVATAASITHSAARRKATWFQQKISDPSGLRKLSFPILTVVADGRAAADAEAASHEDPSVQVSTLLAEGQETCVICFESFEANDEVTFLPSCRTRGCRAFFHRGDENCAGITRWLENHPACPLCRTPHGEQDDDDGWQTEDEKEKEDFDTERPPADQ
jgi:hypothetical protein